MTSTKTKTPKLAKALPAPSWGWELKRAREEVASLTLAETCEAISQFLIVDASTISRLEKHSEVPNRLGQRRSRYLAYLLAVTYGIEPSAFDLDDDDVPPAILSVVREQGIPSTRWSTDGPAPPPDAGMMPRAAA